jgi:DNA polymerase-3 subunit beta
MKLAANASELAAALSSVELALDARIVVAILGGIHIAAGADGTLRLTVNALDRVVAVTVTAEVAQAGDTVVRATALAGLVRGFAKDVMVTVTADAQGAQVRCGRATYKLPVMPIEQLPVVPAIDVVTGEVELNRKELLGAVKQVAFAASTEETRYYMNGILLHDDGQRLALVATDGHRLAKHRIPSAPLSSDRGCIISNATVTALIKLLSKTVAEDVRLRRSKALLELTASGVTLVSKLIDGTYPDYERVIPAASANSATVDHADLVAVLTRLEAVSAHEKNLQDLVGLAWGPAEPALHLSLPHQPGAAADVIAATVAGDLPVQTAAQLRHIVELVDELHGKRVCIASSGAGNPILVTDPEDAGHLIVQMPCRVSANRLHAA